MTRAVMWFRRDLRLSDNPALLAAARHAGPGGELVALFCRDPHLEASSGAPRRAFLAGCLAALDRDLGGRLVVRTGRPEDVVPQLAASAGATAVFAAEDFGPYGRRRDRGVAEALERRGVPLLSVGSPYAVPPGELLTRAGTPFKVFTPFSRAWRAHGWPKPVRAPGRVTWVEGLESDRPPDVPSTARGLPEPGERAAKGAARRFFAGPLDRYAADRDRPDLDATSRLSAYLKWGCIHPRQLLAKLGQSAAHAAFRSELCWREFYADVLWHRPDTVSQALAPAMRRMEVDEGPEADAAFAAWAAGGTGYPIVDAGMRQLATEGWMHNRVRMVVASFLVKDLHLDWSRGARHFMALLVDGDLASNHHGWQWVAGTGTDAAPYFRVFNPVTQGERHDPSGDYIRRWIPELRSTAGPGVHRPWTLDGGPPAGYPPPIVDHARERAEALRRYAAVQGEQQARPRAKR